jgi:hypothetical protein
VDSEKRVVGMLSRHDVLRVFDRPDHDITSTCGTRLVMTAREGNGERGPAEAMASLR